MEKKRIIISNPAMVEIDITALFGGISDAQKTANQTGQDQTIKLSDYATEDTGND